MYHITSFTGQQIGSGAVWADVHSGAIPETDFRDRTTGKLRRRTKYRCVEPLQVVI